MFHRQQKREKRWVEIIKKKLNWINKMKSNFILSKTSFFTARDNNWRVFRLHQLRESIQNPLIYLLKEEYMIPDKDCRNLNPAAKQIHPSLQCSFRSSTSLNSWMHITMATTLWWNPERPIQRGCGNFLMEQPLWDMIKKTTCTKTQHPEHNTMSCLSCFYRTIETEEKDHGFVDRVWN